MHYNMAFQFLSTGHWVMWNILFKKEAGSFLFSCLPLVEVGFYPLPQLQSPNLLLFQFLKNAFPHALPALTVSVLGAPALVQPHTPSAAGCTLSSAHFSSHRTTCACLIFHSLLLPRFLQLRLLPFSSSSRALTFLPRDFPLDFPRSFCL